MRRQNPSVKRRNVVLKIETYRRLEKYKVKLVKREENPKVTFDDVIDSLLDEVMGKQY